MVKCLHVVAVVVVLCVWLVRAVLDITQERTFSCHGNRKVQAKRQDLFGIFGRIVQLHNSVCCWIAKTPVADANCLASGLSQSPRLSLPLPSTSLSLYSPDRLITNDTDT